MKKHRNVLSALFIVLVIFITSCVSYAQEGIGDADVCSIDDTIGALDDAERKRITGTVTNVYGSGQMMSAAEKEAVLAAMNDEVKSKAIDDLHTTALAYGAMVDMMSYNLTPSELNECFQALLNNYPDMYFLSRTYEYTIDPTGGTVDSCYFIYEMDKETVDDTQAKIDAEVDKIFATIEPGMSRADQIAMVNNYFAHNYTYDWDHYYNPGDYTRHYTIPALFIDKTAVCQGFGLGFQYVMEKLNIPCITVQSEAMMHLWNLVQAREDNENWYHIDTTWDTTWVNTSPFMFFLKSDNGFKNFEYYGDTSSRHYDYVPDGRATDETYDDLVLAETSIEPVYANGNWYIGKSATDWQNANTIYRYSFATNEHESIVTVKDDWAYEGYGVGVYAGWYFNNVVSYNNKLYYNDSTKIYEFDPETETSSVLCGNPTGLIQNSTSIYKISLDGNTIIYTIAGMFQQDTTTGSITGTDYTVTIGTGGTGSTFEVNGKTITATFTGISGAEKIYFVFYDSDKRYLSNSGKDSGSEDTVTVEADIPDGVQYISAFAVKSAGTTTSMAMCPVGESMHFSADGEEL